MKFQLIVVYAVLVVAFSSCAGTIHTSGSLNSGAYKKAFIVAAHDSQYIKFKFLYMYLGDHTPSAHEKIGNTDLVIKNELEKRGIYSVIGVDGEIPEDIDLIVSYNDVWRWDFKPILDNLDIVFISPETKEEIAKATYNIYYNKEMHNFPNAEKEVPKMMEELLRK